MLAFLGTSIGRDVIIGLLLLIFIGGAYSYYMWSQAEMSSLKANYQIVEQQANDLKMANDVLNNQIASIKTAQDAANKSILEANTKASAAEQAIRSAIKAQVQQAKTNPRALEIQINADTEKALKTLSDLSQIQKNP